MAPKTIDNRNSFFVDACVLDIFIDHGGESRKRAEILFSCVLGNLCCFILSLGL